jgi:hypothetical protein
VVDGELGPRYRRAFEGLTLESCAGTTAIVGVVDQSQLQGVMARIADLGLTLVSVTRDSDELTGSD